MCIGREWRIWNLNLDEPTKSNSFATYVAYRRTPFTRHFFQQNVLMTPKYIVYGALIGKFWTWNLEKITQSNTFTTFVLPKNAFCKPFLSTESIDDTQMALRSFPHGKCFLETQLLAENHFKDLPHGKWFLRVYHTANVFYGVPTQKMVLRVLPHGKYFLDACHTDNGSQAGACLTKNSVSTFFFIRLSIRPCVWVLCWGLCFLGENPCVGEFLNIYKVPLCEGSVLWCVETLKIFKVPLCVGSVLWYVKTLNIYKLPLCVGSVMWTFQKISRWCVGNSIRLCLKIAV